MLFDIFWIIANVGSSAGIDNDKEIEENKDRNRYPASFYLLLPVAGLILLLFGQTIFNKLLLQLDRRCLSVLCPSLSQREQLLKWACNRLPSTWSSHTKTLAGGVAELWADGSLLCTLINTAIPGACPNPHRHWNKPPCHAQAIAYKYLGVIPIFTEKDLSGNLNSNLERNFLFYLNELQHSISRLTEREENIKQFSAAYIPRGMGLFSGEQHRKTIFFVYANPESKTCNTNTIIQIRGPYGTYGQAIIPKFQNTLFAVPDATIISDTMTSKQLIRHSKSINFLETFPFSFIKYHKKHMGDNIIIDVTIEKDRAKITYIPKNYGMYEINMVSNGEHLKGCPYHVHIFNNTSGLEDNFEEEDKAEIIPKYRRRKVISKTIDLIDNNLPLSEFHDKFQKYKQGGEINPSKEIITKPIFNFREVVEEITKNGKLFNNLITKEEFGGNKRETLLHIQCDDAYLSEIEVNRVAIEDGQTLEITPYVEVRNISEISPIPEAEEKESVISSENDNYQEIVFEKHNLESVTENDVIKSQNANLLNITKLLSAQTYSTNTSTDTLDQQQLISTDKLKINTRTDESTLSYDESDFDVNKKEFEDPEKVVMEANSVVNESGNQIINKIQIPDKFSNQLHRTLVNELSSKHYKNVVNNCSKPIKKCKNHSQYPDRANKYNITKPNKNYHQSEDFNNNVKMGFYEVNKNLEDLDIRPNLSSNIKHTSPICPVHIESEVDYKQMSVAEKRKIFAQEALPSLHNSSNNSYSEYEGSACSTSIKNYNFEGLSVLNVLKSLKESQSISNTESYSLSSTKSLPDISMNLDNISSNMVRVKKHFWETISLRSSRSSSIKTSNSHRNGKLLSQLERDKQIWKTPGDQKFNQVYMDKSREIYKSADDILSMTNMFQHQYPKKYKSMDTSLDTCTILTIDERKKLLLKQNYEKEKMEKRYFRSEIYVKKKNAEKENKMTLTNEYSSIRDKIRKYNSVSNLSYIEEEKAEVNDTKNRTPSTELSIKPLHDDIEPIDNERYTFKSQFKRAVKYFKNLETQYTGKTKSKTIAKSNRKFSLDFSVKKKAHRKGGSLDLTNVSEKFSVCNLYEDVYGRKTGSFSGTPNKKALLEALATFSHKENRLYNSVDNDDIEFEIFKRRAKLKKRKSVKSIFDLYY